MTYIVAKTSLSHYRDFNVFVKMINDEWNLFVELKMNRN